MKQTFGNIALGKKIDLGLQVLAFLTVLPFCKDKLPGPFVLYAFGAAQTISALMWTLYFHKGPPAYTRAVNIRISFLALAPFLVMSFLAGRDTFLMVSWVMLAAGPLLGLSYFIITILEIRYYSKARKPYYLL